MERIFRFTKINFRLNEDANGKCNTQSYGEFFSCNFILFVTKLKNVG